VRRYYTLDLAERELDEGERMRRLDELLQSAVHLRLQADVRVGAYLSGGLDSSITTALAARAAEGSLRTFSVTFADRAFDESAPQAEVVAHVGTRHALRHIHASDIAPALRDVVLHAETPLVRTAAAPMLLLSRLVRDRGVKVVLSGEGADETFLGYELFKETLLRRNALGAAGSTAAGAELAHLYPDHPARGRQGAFWREFFLRAGPVDDPLFSHLPRFKLTSRIKEFYAPDFREAVGGFDALDELRGALPAAFGGWTPLARAAWLEMTTLLSPYLLSTQGDRMAMASGVELRVPFLDHRLVELAAAMPVLAKLDGLRDKAILRTWAARVLPERVAERPKQAYRAPDVSPFIGSDAPEWVDDLLEPRALRDVGVFDPSAVAGLVRRRKAGRAESELERQALVAIVTTGLWHRAFVEERSPRPRHDADHVCATMTLMESPRPAEVA
jgi:asparagine synthase (glutamine-hydrolysing)